MGKPRLPKREKLKKNARVTSRIQSIANTFVGDRLTAAHNIAKFVLEQLPYEEGRADFKTRLFRMSAGHALRKKITVGDFHCVERSNLAIAVLHGAGISSWLVRGLRFDSLRQKWLFHDAVEFVHGGKIYTMDFFIKKHGGFVINEGNAEKHINVQSQRPSIVFRGADSNHLGITNWEDYVRFSNRFFKNIGVELEANEKRVRELIKHRIIPKEVAPKILSLL